MYGFPVLAFLLLTVPAEPAEPAGPTIARGPTVARVKSKQAKGKRGKKKRKKRGAAAAPEVEIPLDLNQPEPEPPPVQVGGEVEVHIDLGPVDVAGQGSVAAGVEPVPIEDTVLVMNLRAVDFTEEGARTVTTILTELLAARPTLRVIGVDEVLSRARRHKPPHLFTCKGDACAQPMARSVQATLALTGFVGRIDQEYIVSLSTLDVETGAAGGNATRRTPTLESLPEVLPGLLAEVFGWADDGAVTSTRFMLPEGRDILFAVLDLRPEGLTRETSEEVAAILAKEIRKVDGAMVMGRPEIVRLVGPELDELRNNCAGETACLAEMGLALEADKLVVGTVGKLGESFVISLRLIDVRTMAIDNRMYEVVRGLREQLAPAMKSATRRLLGLSESAEPGAVVLTGNVTGGTVSLDDREVGRLPMLIHDLSPGRYALRVIKAGFLEWTSDVFVEPGKTVTLPVRLEAIEVPPEWDEHWWIWTGIGTAIATGVTLGVAFYVDSATKLPDTTGGSFQL